MVGLTRATGEKGLGLREWRPLFNAEGAWTEQILVQVADESELRRMHASLQGKHVNVSHIRKKMGPKKPRFKNRIQLLNRNRNQNQNQNHNLKQSLNKSKKHLF